MTSGKWRTGGRACTLRDFEPGVRLWGVFKKTIAGALLERERLSGDEVSEIVAEAGR